MKKRGVFPSLNNLYFNTIIVFCINSKSLQIQTQTENIFVEVFMLNIEDELYEKLVEYEEAESILDDIDELDDLLLEEEYDKKKVIEIETKYSIETKFLLGFENNGNLGFEKNYEEPTKQVLENLRTRLYYIAVLKILEEKGIEIPKDFLKKRADELTVLI